MPEQSRIAVVDGETIIFWEDEVDPAKCAHIWPDQLVGDALCTQGCGVAYQEWAYFDREDTER